MLLPQRLGITNFIGSGHASLSELFVPWADPALSHSKVDKAMARATALDTPRRVTNNDKRAYSTEGRTTQRQLEAEPLQVKTGLGGPGWQQGVISKARAQAQVPSMISMLQSGVKSIPMPGGLLR